MWIEKVNIETRRQGDVDSELMGGISAKATAMRAIAEELAELESLFTDLRNKIPVELRLDEGLADGEAVLTSQAHIAASLNGAVNLLSAMLSENGAP